MSEAAVAAGNNAFWQFSLRLYSSSAVQEACLALQDGSGVDVNVMLFALYMASQGKRLSEAEIRQIADSVESWRTDVVVPLRSARRALKSPAAAIDPAGAESLRSIVKKAELEAERLQQVALFARSGALGTPSAPGITAALNLQAYAAALGRQLAAAPVGVMLSAYEARLA